MKLYEFILHFLFIYHWVMAVNSYLWQWPPSQPQSSPHSLSPQPPPQLSHPQPQPSPLINFNQFLNFFVSSRTAFDDFTFKNQVGTGQRVIEVNYYNVRFDFHYAGVHTLAIASLQRYDVTFFDVFAIEFTVNFEDMFRKVDNVLFVILSVCFICRNGKSNLSPLAREVIWFSKSSRCCYLSLK